MREVWYIAIVICCLVQIGFSEINNVCNSFPDYFTNTGTNPRCYYNPAMNHHTPDIVRLSGYPFEEHTVITPDGYILKLHRIPNTNHPNPQRSPIWLQHGITITSACFVAIGNESFAFVLADNGYDVWMANARGNIYSAEHVTMNVNDDAYWNYSLDEVATEDLPLCLEYVSRATGTLGEIVYIGHSMGGPAAIIFASEKDLEAKRLVKIFILMGPAFRASEALTPYRPVFYLFDAINEVLERLHLHKLASNGEVTNALLQAICLNSPLMMKICFGFSLQLFGTRTGVGPNVLPVLFTLPLNGMSFRVAKQVYDTVRSPLRKYNYGPHLNLQMYGTKSPPEYDMSRIKVPMHVIIAENDWLTSILESKLLYNNLPIEARHGFYIVPSKDFNHMDYILGPEGKELVVDYILNILRNFR